MVYALGVGAAGALVCTVMGGSLLYGLLSLIGVGRFISVGYIFGFALIVSIVAIPPLFFELRKRSLARTVYHFFGDHLEFQYFQFLISPRRGRVRYDGVQDVYQNASALQAHRQLTSIYLYVPGMRYRQAGFAGLEIADVPQRKDYMNRIIDIIEKRGASRLAAAAPPAAAEAGPPGDA